MTYWHDTPDGHRDLYHWMGIAISLAFSINLHRNTETTGLPPGEQKLRKRIWWACFMRDQIIALGARKPSRIQETNTDMPALVVSDFETDAVLDESTDVARQCILLRNTSMQQVLALMCIAKSELCVYLGRILDSQYVALPSGGEASVQNTQSTRLLYPFELQHSLYMFECLVVDLKRWKHCLPTVCQYRPLVSIDAEAGNAVLATQRTVLHMLYQTTVLALYRPQSLSTSSKDSPATPWQVEDTTWSHIHDAATKITHMVANLSQYRLEECLPTTTVVLILPAMIAHVLRMQYGPLESRPSACHDYVRCMRVLETLSHTFYGADFAITFLNSVVGRTGIQTRHISLLGKVAAPVALVPQLPNLGMLVNGNVQPGVSCNATVMPLNTTYAASKWPTMALEIDASSKINTSQLVSEQLQDYASANEYNTSDSMPGNEPMWDLVFLDRLEMD